MCMVLLGCASENTFFSSSAQPEGRFVRGTLVIQDGNHSVKIPDVSGPPDRVPELPQVISIQKQDGEYFAVVTTSEYTNGYPPRGGPGGCGIEACLEWLHIVGDKVIERTRQKYESWLDNRSCGTLSRESPIITMTTDDLLEKELHAGKNDCWQTITFQYDTRHPEDGIKQYNSKTFSSLNE